ncbi:MAG: S8 family serine peptidase [Akkermansiaceae bacterium]
MRNFSLTLLAIAAASGQVFSQTTGLLNPDPGAVVPEPGIAAIPAGTHQFQVRGKKRNYTMCTFEMCRRDKDGELKVRPVAAGSPAAVVAQASVPDEENFIVFYPTGKEGVPAARRVLRHRYLVKLAEGADLNAIQNRCGMKTIKRLSPGSDYAVCEEVSSARVLNQLQAVLADPDVEETEPLLARKRVKRILPTDPFIEIYGLVSNPDGFPDEETYQWYLENDGFNGGSAGIDINISPAFDFATGDGVTVTVVDDGVALDHTELAANAAGANLHLNLVEESRDPTTFDIFANHGTNVAGLISSESSFGGAGIGMSGAAPESTFTAVRLLGGFVDDVDEGIALGWGFIPVPDPSDPDGGTILPISSDISNNSWGPEDTTLNFEAPGASAAESLRFSVVGDPDDPTVQPARGGLGGIYVWSAGNGGEINDNSNYDGYANSIYTIAVGAVNDAGRRPVYSERGANLVVSAPSAGGTQSVLTTAFDVGLDLDGNPVRIPIYDTEFGGTSAAAPLVSGVVALMLEANPDLTWRDVQDILVRTAAQNDALAGGWFTNAAGLHFNHDYGAGLVDAGAAVQAAAERGTGTPPADPRLGDNDFLGDPATPQEKFFFFLRNGNPDQQSGFIPDFDPNAPVAYNLTFDFSEDTNLNVEHVELNMTVITENRSDLEIILISPSGTQSILQEADFDHTEQGISNWTFTSMRNWGEDSAGTWVLRIVDRIAGTESILNDATITLHGVEDPDGGVVGAPVLVSSPLIEVDQNQDFSYFIEAVGATEIAVGDLPEGLTFNEATDTISGSVEEAGFYQIPILLNGEGGGNSTPIVSLVVRPVEDALGDALGLPDYDVVTSGDFPWEFEFIDTNDPNDPADEWVAARSATGLGDLQESSFGFNGLPKGVLLFDWKTSSEEGFDRLWFNFEGTVPQTWESFISGERGWGTVAVAMPEDSNNVRWIYAKDGPKGTGTDFSGEDRGLIDNVRIVDSDKYLQDLKDAIGIEGFEIEMDSRTLWRPISFPPNAPTPNALFSSSVGNGQTVSLSGWLDGPGTLTVKARNFAEETDLFEVLLDGIVINEVQAGGGVGNDPFDGVDLTQGITPGRHRLQVRIRKDFRGSLGRTILNQIYDGVVMTELKFVPLASFQTLADSLGVGELAPHDDFDGDGYSNHEEYAFGGDILVADIPKNIPRLVTKDGRSYIEYGIDTSKTDLIYIPQQSTNMTNWVDAQLMTMDRVEGDIQFYQIPVLSLPGRTHLYYRLVAEPK